MLKKIDIYIIKKFLGTYFYAIALIIGIVIVFDISEKIDDFIEKEAPIRQIIFNYYMNFIPYFANLFSALFTCIAVIYFTSKLANNSEIIAMLSNGISFNRILVPYFISASVIAVFSLVLINFVIPPANRVRLEFENTYLRNEFRNKDRNIHMQISPGVYVYMESYNTRNDIGQKFSMEKFKDGKLVSKLFADYIKWDTAKNKWKINHCYIRDFDGIHEKLTKKKSIDTTLTIFPSDFKQRSNVVETMNYFELNNFIKKEKMKGSDNIDTYLIEKYRRYSFPFATFILTLIGVSLASRKVRGGVGLHIGVGIFIAFTYVMFMQVSTVFATNGSMNTLLAVWIPNIIFSGIAFLLYRYAPK
ncbi:MAG: YjgP/YjgQ family permease [Chlorobi bacterium]|nr:YjgP/YjgQ family permease [Chlorobiota bacterium]